MVLVLVLRKQVLTRSLFPSDVTFSYNPVYMTSFANINISEFRSIVR